jgi:hypothetical protein
LDICALYRDVFNGHATYQVCANGKELSHIVRPIEFAQAKKRFELMALRKKSIKKRREIVESIGLFSDWHRE